MKTKPHTHQKFFIFTIIITFAFAIAARADVDPRTNSWFTTFAGKYARIYTTDLNRTNGNSVTMWTNSSYVQQIPAYCGVQEVYSSSNWVYVRSTGLGSHVMGAWYLNSNHTSAFPSYPTNQKVMFRIPRTYSIPSKKTLSGGGSIGIAVDGVALYNNWDAYFWNGSADTSSSGTNGFWNRDAYVNEGMTFDPAYAHQPQSGQYHYHASPVALRYELGDHVNLDPVTKIYSEATNTVTKHSPILGWAADGFPIYGPYGYSVSNNATSGIKRMVSGFVIRNGQYGTSNLTANGRTTIPQWAVRLYGVASNILSGPTVSTSYPLGRYMEDNDYLGDHGYKQGTDFDLDEYNGRWCVTPEFPSGTYAYFVAISSNGTPVYPYNLGLGYYGTPSGGIISATGGAATLTDVTATNFLGYTNVASTINSPIYGSGGFVSLKWSGIDGGSYSVQATTNLASSSWSTLISGVAINTYATNGIYATYLDSAGSLDKRFYRVARNSVASYDGAGATSFAVSGVAPGGSAARGQTVQLTITFTAGGSNPPNLPPTSAPVSSVSIGSISGTSNSYVNNSTYGTETATFTIPANATTGTQTVSITFSAGPTFTVSSAFTIN
jgi:YHYH protein